MKLFNKIRNKKKTGEKKQVAAGLDSGASTTTVEPAHASSCSSSNSIGSIGITGGYNGYDDASIARSSENNSNTCAGSTRQRRPVSKNCVVRKLTSGKLSSNGRVMIFYSYKNENGSVEVQLHKANHQKTTTNVPMLPIVNETSAVSDTSSPVVLDGDRSSSSSSWSDPFYQAQTGELLADNIASEADVVARRMVSNLTEEELDIAKNSSYEYYLMIIKYQMLHSPETKIPETTMYCKDTMNRVWNDRNCAKWTKQEIDRFGLEASIILAKRILINMSMKENNALLKLKDSLQFRISKGKLCNANSVRFCFSTDNHEKDNNDNDIFAEYRQQCRGFMGKKARTFVLNYDNEGRAQLYSTARFCPPETRFDCDGLLGSHGYIFERALACTNRHSKGKQDMVNIILDFKGFIRKDHSQPIAIAHEFLNRIKESFSERIYRIYLVDAPLIARLVIGMLKPFITSFIGKDIIFVTGKKQREEILGKELHETCTENVDMEKYYAIPFDQSYTDVYDL